MIIDIDFLNGICMQKNNQLFLYEKCGFTTEIERSGANVVTNLTRTDLKPYRDG